jgi:hypothetical protein
MNKELMIKYEEFSRPLQRWAAGFKPMLVLDGRVAFRCAERKGIIVTTVEPFINPALNAYDTRAKRPLPLLPAVAPVAAETRHAVFLRRRCKGGERQSTLTRPLKRGRLLSVAFLKDFKVLKTTLEAEPQKIAPILRKVTDGVTTDRNQENPLIF